MRRFAIRLFQIALVLVSLVIILAITLRFILCRPMSPDVALEQADQMAWLNNWIGAEPFYKQAELQFIQRHELSKALYARVSQMPAAMESRSLPDQIWTLTQDLARPEANNAQTRLRMEPLVPSFEELHGLWLAYSKYQTSPVHMRTVFAIL